MVPLPFEMFVGEDDGVFAVRLTGRLEAPWAHDVHRMLVRHSPAAVRLDVSGLTGVDLAGLQTIVAIRQEVVSGGGRFVLRGGNVAVRATFAASGLDALVEDSPDDAVAVGAIARLPLKRGGRDARRSAAVAPKVA